jgi:hypothetical protein
MQICGIKGEIKPFASIRELIFLDRKRVHPGIRRSLEA